MAFFNPPQIRLAAPALAGVLGACALLAPMTATLAGTAPGWTKQSHVSDTVADNGNGTWTYDYTVHNDSSQPGSDSVNEPFIVDWELPFFDDAGFAIGDVFSPTGWSAAIETIGTPNGTTGWDGVAEWQTPGDPLYAGPDSPFTTTTQVLHWFSDCWVFGGEAEGCGEFNPLTNAIGPGSSLADFGFIADFDKTNAPYQASWADLPVQTGDPALPLGGLPASPNAIGTSGVPAPDTLALLLAGVVGGGIAARRRRARDQNRKR
jgi:hypothetical protein